MSIIKVVFVSIISLLLSTNLTFGLCPMSGVKDDSDFGMGCCGLSLDKLDKVDDFLKDLREEVKDLKMSLTDLCDGNNDTDGHSGPNKQKKTTPNPRTVATTTDFFNIAAGYTPTPEIADTTTPPVPTRCPRGFNILGGGCFKLYTTPGEWKSFGDADEMCRALNGRLATPHRPQMLRDYLKEKNLAMKYWVGAKRATRKSWKWLNEKEMTSSDWVAKNPSRNGSKRCVYWRHPTYFAVNHYCGEKFPFICEYKN